jgi:hypothetical protein
MAGGEVDEGRRRRSEGGGLERRRQLRDFSLPRGFVDEMKGPGYLSLNLGFHRLEWKIRDRPSKFFEGLRV